MYVKTQSEVLQMWEFSELWKRMEIFWVDSNSDSMLWVSKESIHGSRIYLLSGYTSLRMNKVSQSPCLNGVTLQLSNEVWISFFSTLHRLFSCVLVHLACKVILILFGNISRIESLCVCVLCVCVSVREGVDSRLLLTSSPVWELEPRQLHCAD